MVLVALTAVLSTSCGPRLKLAKADRLMNKGKWSEAETLLQGIAASHGGSKWSQKALMLKGCVQFKQGRLEDAGRTLESARDLMPHGEWADDAEYYLARVRFRQGDYVAARDGFRRVMTGFGDDPKRSNCKSLALEELEYLEKKGLAS
jgi:outer membrane protein assembly factor BamD (BamD/ComL family)